jgi:hypothetical protein
MAVRDLRELSVIKNNQQIRINQGFSEKLYYFEYLSPVEAKQGTMIHHRRTYEK